MSLNRLTLCGTAPLLVPSKTIKGSRGVVSGVDAITVWSVPSPPQIRHPARTMPLPPNLHMTRKDGLHLRFGTGKSRRTLTSRTLQMAITESAAQMNFGVTVQWHKRCVAAVNLLKKAQRLSPQTDLGDIARGLIWVQKDRMKASSLKTFKAALVAGVRREMQVNLTEFPSFEGVSRWIARNLALHPSTPTPAMPPEVVRNVIGATTDQDLKATITGLFTTASRFSDLRHARLAKNDLKLSAHKGDFLGKIGYHKFIPRPLIPDMRRALEAVQGNRVTYRRLLQLIKRVDPTMSVVSLRRGAMTLLARDYETRDLMLIGTHASEVSSRRYIEPNEHQTESRKTLTMSSRLLAQIQ